MTLIEAHHILQFIQPS